MSYLQLNLNSFKKDKILELEEKISSFIEDNNLFHYDFSYIEEKGIILISNNLITNEISFQNFLDIWKEIKNNLLLLWFIQDPKDNSLFSLVKSNECRKDKCENKSWEELDKLIYKVPNNDEELNNVLKQINILKLKKKSVFKISS